MALMPTRRAALLLLGSGGIAALAYGARSAVSRWFGPPRVAMAETYAQAPTDTSFDHAALDRLLRKHVDGDGWVDYAGLRAGARELDTYLAALAAAPFEVLGRDEKLALLLNAYNAFTLRLIMDRWPIGSIMDVPAGRRWAERRWVFAGRRVSLDDLEHGEIRPHFREPRVHFALVCAAVGCPKLRSEAYVAARLDAQLDDQMRYCHASERWFRFDRAAAVAYASALYDWYRDDFLTSAPSVLAFIAPYSPALRQALATGVVPALEYLPYDWTLNDVARRPTR